MGWLADERKIIQCLVEKETCSKLAINRPRQWTEVVTESSEVNFTIT